MMETHGFDQGRWNLGDLLSAPSGPPLESIKGELEAKTVEFESYRARLSDEMEQDEFLSILRDFEKITSLAHRLGAYAELWFTEDTQSTGALTFKRQIEQLLTDLGNRTLFFSLWWKSLTEEAAERLMTGIGDFRYFLEVMRLFKPHTLAESEEQIINLKDMNGINGLVTLYEMLTNRFEFTLRVKGKLKHMTRGELSTYVRDPSPRVRAAAYRELLRVFREHGPELAQIYAYRTQDWRAEQIQLRHFKSPIAARNLANDIPDEATETLLEVCRENAVVFQRYFKHKARWLGLAKLHRFDIYAPLAASDKKYPYREAVEMVLDSFESFSPRVAGLARQVFEAGHVDSEIRPRKMSGAFCYGVLPEVPPYVLLNYAGRANDVSTMAHEFGHAIHSMLASEHSVLTFHSALPMAETASVFAEMILTERLLENEKNPDVRRDLLATKVDDTYATVLRQSFFVMFEREAHDLIARGKSTDDLCARYLENLREQFGDAVEIGDEFMWEWVSIPHFYAVPFYTYAYSFGNLLTLSLYSEYRSQGQSFIPRYLKILSYGGSASPVHILQEAGIDIRSKEFWRGGFQIIKEWIAELESLPPPKRRSAHASRNGRETTSVRAKKGRRSQPRKACAGSQKNRTRVRR